MSVGDHRTETTARVNEQIEQMRENSKMRVYVDGNPKEVCCVAASDIGVLGRSERAKLDGENTNNVAEYRAVLFGLYKHPEATRVYSDSQLVVKQLQGNYAVRNQTLLFWWGRLQKRLEQLGHEVKFTWVPREDNPARKVLG